MRSCRYPGNQTDGNSGLPPFFAPESMLIFMFCIHVPEPRISLRETTSLQTFSLVVFACLVDVQLPKDPRLNNGDVHPRPTFFQNRASFFFTNSQSHCNRWQQKEQVVRAVSAYDVIGCHPLLCLPFCSLPLSLALPCWQGVLHDADTFLTALGPIHTGRACANSNANPLMLLGCSVDTPIHINRSHLLCVASCILCGLSLREPVAGVSGTGTLAKRTHLSLEVFVRQVGVVVPGRADVVEHDDLRLLVVLRQPLHRLLLVIDQLGGRPSRPKYQHPQEPHSDARKNIAEGKLKE